MSKKKTIKFVLPLRQKILLAITLAIGVYIFFNWLTFRNVSEGMNVFIIVYGFGIPLFLLSDSAIIDLNNKKIFIIWLAVGALQLVVSLCTNQNDTFLIVHSNDFDKSSGINSWISDYSTSSLKTLFIFLIAYWVLNSLIKKFTGNCIVNTFRQMSWYNADAKRQMNGWDVLSNIVLFVIIILSGLFGH